MVPPVATMTTLGFFAPWARAAPASSMAAAPITPAVLSTLMCIPSDSGSDLLLLVLVRVEVGQFDLVEQVFDLRLGEDLLLPDDLEDPLAAPVHLVGELGGLLVAQHRIERGHDPDCGLHVVLQHLLVHSDPIHALGTQQ